MAKYLVGGQPVAAVVSSAEECGVKGGHLAVVSWKPAATLQNYQCGNQFHQFSLFPLARSEREREREGGNIFVIRLESRAEICGLKGIET